MSSLNNGISGLHAAAQHLNVLSNNIANANTTGYKAKTISFADVFSATGAGGGVYVADISTEYAQGAVNRTSNSLDLAINGGGFFITKNANGSALYTRAGNFQTDKEGFIVNPQNQKLQGYAVDKNGTLMTGTTTDLKINTADKAPKATSEANLTANLDARQKPIPAKLSFDPANKDTYNFTSNNVVYDAQGKPHTVSSYYVKTADNSWKVYNSADGKVLTSGKPAKPTTLELKFDQQGNLTSPNPHNYSISFDTGSAGQLTYKMDISGLSQRGKDSSVAVSNQNGYAPGSFTGIQVADDGSIFATYSNGKTTLQGAVALATFPNEGGLKDAGNTSWTVSPDSGAPIISRSGKGRAGTLMARALEKSNVDLTSEMVNMVVAQSNYQANAKSIDASNKMTQVLMNTI